MYRCQCQPVAVRDESNRCYLPHLPRRQQVLPAYKDPCVGRRFPTSRGLPAGSRLMRAANVQFRGLTAIGYAPRIHSFTVSQCHSLIVRG